MGAKLCQTAFQMIPDVSFFDAGKLCSTNISDRKFQFSLMWRGFGGAFALSGGVECALAVALGGGDCGLEASAFLKFDSLHCLAWDAMFRVVAVPSRFLC